MKHTGHFDAVGTWFREERKTMALDYPKPECHNAEYR